MRSPRHMHATLLNATMLAGIVSILSTVAPYGTELESVSIRPRRGHRNGRKNRSHWSRMRTRGRAARYDRRHVIEEACGEAMVNGQAYVRHELKDGKISAERIDPRIANDHDRDIHVSASS